MIIKKSNRRYHCIIKTSSGRTRYLKFFAKNDYEAIDMAHTFGFKVNSKDDGLYRVITDCFVDFTKILTDHHEMGKFCNFYNKIL